MGSIKQKSILILGSFSKGALEHQYVRGLKENGWIINCIDIQQNLNDLKNKNILNKIFFNLSPDTFLKDINQKVISNAKKDNPLVILIFKGMELWPETIKELKNNCNLICNYNPDHPFNFYSKGAGNKNVSDSINYYDIYFSYATSICKQLEKRFKVNSYCIPFGFDETIKPISKKTLNISDQFLFIGAWDQERECKLKDLSAIPLQIFGPDIWQRKINNYGELKYNLESLYEQEYANACLNSSGILNFLRPQNITEQSHNMRTFEVPGYGGLLIAERTTEQLAFFEEDKEAIYFDDLDELKSKLKYLSKTPLLISNLKFSAYERAKKSNYGYSHRTRELITIINSLL